MKNKNRFLVVLTMLSIVSTLFLFNCNNSSNSEEKEDPIDNEVPDTPDVTTSGDTLRIPVVHHISRRDDGTNAPVDEARIKKIMGDINKNFKPGKIQFYTKEIKFLDNTGWNTSFLKQDDFRDLRLLKSFEDDKAANIFYFRVLQSNSGGNLRNIGATALFPDEGNNIKLTSSSVTMENTGTASHELGHYLGLYHTDDDFRGPNGNTELVDGSNCEQAGDKICDTPASPVLNDGNMRNCAYIGTEKDANGMQYNPDTFNIMTSSGRTRSDADGLCRRRFSQGQIDKMVSVLEGDRSYLITRK
ncbi:M43 family zinc metalloprotease [Hyunsoonleella ulvae]|uniref:M43 family zinc metalloprotease n=1 Tax=Hyunsoonleella ulvae TaxID=2799948 RepID=UPI00193ADAAF|nr:M43 family zinc metalloprotease [Hyunsoonleella ulvae]